jgi:hypothetical protein
MISSCKAAVLRTRLELLSERPAVVAEVVQATALLVRFQDLMTKAVRAGQPK